MRCPLCDVSMKEIDRRGATVDVCPECRGVWLDRGELEALLEGEDRFYEEQDRTRNRHYEDERRSGGDSRDREDQRDRQRPPYEKESYGKRKPKGFLGEVLGSLGDLGGD